MLEAGMAVVLVHPLAPRPGLAAVPRPGAVGTVILDLDDAETSVVFGQRRFRAMYCIPTRWLAPLPDAPPAAPLRDWIEPSD